MERAWKVTYVLIGLVLIGLCSGFPIGLENSAADYHTQFLTGLVGVLLTVCGVVFLAGCLCCQRKNGFKEFHNNPVVASSTSSLDHGHINPIANGEFTIFTPLSPPHHNNNVFLANEQIVGQTEIDYNHADIDVRSWFDGSESDFPRTRLKYIKELGKGWFGRVVEGTAQILNDGDEKQNWTPVAVRILEASATSSERAVFLHDAVIYRCGKHPHILQLLGRSLESVPLLLLQELCPHGDLKKYLRDNRSTAEKLLSSDLPLLWCCQLSSALKHLHDHRLTHPDLAARNCQIVSDLSIKLGDYGLAASLYPEDYYQGAPAVPVRWCAPESLTYTSTTIQPKQITFESNVWSLGVTMWEIYECGALPYANLNDDDVLSQVLGSANVRLSKPEFSILYTDYIFRLMQLCWSTSESRPSVSQVHLMLTDLMQVYQNTKHITHSEPLISIQDFDKRWDTFKPNTVAKTDNHEFTQEGVSMADVDLSDITVLNLNLSKDEELLNTKPMSPSLNNLHGSLDNLASGEMDSWLQKVATKTGDMSYVRGLSEAIKDLDNTLALENVSSSDSSHQPSPAPENLPNAKNKLEFKLGPTSEINDLNKTQNSSLTESMQRTSSESETEDENWRRKIERGAYSEKVHQKSKSVTDLMVLTHIDCSESDSETPLPSLDYRVNYKNVRYAPKQNLENVSLMFGSEGNLLSVHDKFQEELRRLQEERKDSLLFVPESISHNDEKPKQNKDRIGRFQRGNDNSSSDEETWTVRKSEDAACTYVNIKPSTSVEQPENSNLNNKNVSPNHRNPESLIEELSSPTDIQPGSQVYNIFNVSVGANFSPIHLKSDLKDIICFKDLESNHNFGKNEDCSVAVVNKNFNSESTTQCYQVPKLTDLIQNNDDLMDYIITRYESQEDVNINTVVNVNISENKTIIPGKELNNNIQNSTVQDLPSSSKSTENVQTQTQKFLHNEQQNYELPKVHFDISQTQEEVLPSSMTHSSLFTSTPYTKRSLKSPDRSDEIKGETLQFSSNFSDLNQEEEEEPKSELKYSLETWDNFLGRALDDGTRECSGFDNFSSEPQSLLFVDESRVLNVDTVECKNQALIDNFSLKSENDLGLRADVNITALEHIVNNEKSTETEACPILSDEHDLKEESPNHCEVSENINNTFVVEPNLNKTFVCEKEENMKNLDDANINDVTVVVSPKTEEFDERNNEHLDKTYIKDATFVLNDTDEQLDGTDTKEHEGGSNWEPGEGWFLHPQTNSEVSGQMESQGGEESYVGFSMDDEIMAAIRNELLMKLPQAQGQSSEQVKDTDEWDTEGRSEVLIKYNVYTTPLSPIPEESYSENDSYHFIYNREDNSDSENEDWPEPYEEHNSGLPDTETQSMQNAESPIPEPQNRHTPSQDSCCSNDTLFNLEELTFVVNENENFKIQGDLTERKGCDLFENNKKEAVLDKDLEEPTLKVEAKIEEVIEQNEENKVHLETEVERSSEVLENAGKTESVMKNTNNFQTEIFTCNIEPVQMEALTKTVPNIDDTKNIPEDEVVVKKNKEQSSDEKVECKITDTVLVNLEENANQEVQAPNVIHEQNPSEASDNKKKEEVEITFKTDHDTRFTENDLVTNFLDHHEDKTDHSDDGGLIEAINKNVIAADCYKAQDAEINVSNFNIGNCEISLENHHDDSEIIQNCQAINEKNKLNLETNKVSLEKDEANIKKTTEVEEISKEHRSNINKTFTTEAITAKYEADISKSEVESNEDIKKYETALTSSKTDTNGETCNHDSVKNEVKCFTNLEKHVPLEENETATGQDEVEASCTDLKKYEKDFKKREVTTTQNEVKACQSMNGLEYCEHDEVETQDSEVFSRKNEANVGHKETDLINTENFKKNENIKAGKIVNGNEVAVSHAEVSISHNDIKNHDLIITSKNRVVAGLDVFNNMEKENLGDNKKCEAVLKSKEDNITPQDTDKSAIDLENIKNVNDEVNITKNEAAISQDAVTTQINGIAVANPMCSEECEVVFGKSSVDGADFDVYKSLRNLHSKNSEVDQEHKQYEKCNEVEVEKCEDLNHQSETCSDTINEGMQNINKDRKSSAGIKQCETNLEMDQTNIESFKNTKNSESDTDRMVNILNVDLNQTWEDREKVQVNEGKNKKLEDIGNDISAEKYKVTDKGEERVDKLQMDMMQNGFYSDTAVVALDNININFIKREGGVVEENVERRVGLENTSIDFIKEEGEFPNNVEGKADLEHTNIGVIKEDGVGENIKQRVGVNTNTEESDLPKPDVVEGRAAPESTNSVFIKEDVTVKDEVEENDERRVGLENTNIGSIKEEGDLLKADVVEGRVGLEKTNIGIMKEEGDLPKTDNVERRVGVENTNIGSIKEEGDLPKTDDVEGRVGLELTNIGFIKEQFEENVDRGVGLEDTDIGYIKEGNLLKTDDEKTVSREYSNIGFIKEESGHPKTDDVVGENIERRVETNDGERKVGLEYTNIGFITKPDDVIIKGEAEENGMDISKIYNVEDKDLEKNDVSINKLNIKNTQNGIIPGNSPKWINDNHPDLMNVFVNLNEVNKNADLENSMNSTSSQSKETSQEEANKAEGKICDFTDISLIVENNPNYIIEFLNHERQSSISSLGSSRDEDSSDHVNISLQNSKNVNSKTTTENDYVNVDDISIKFVEHNKPTDSASYVNTNELINITSPPEYVNIVQQEDADEHLYDPVANEGGDDIYDALTDIRFTGPSDVQLMSTSFSESADIDEQDWDSGSDTRSSSSGEFIWKEGEHEESVKALRAAPQDVMATEKLTPMEDIEEVSTESSEDEDGDSPEFVPSAWDKYATPTKSALRSPEKTLEKPEVKHKKPKGVWFKKQKYHCVYEYPREPESPNVNSFDLWQPLSTSLIDWEVDTSPYVPTFDGANPHPECYQQLDKNLYQLTDFTSGMTALDDEFFISSTARPFESFGGLSSQFFPGQTTSDQWMDLSKQANENITPDSGVEDITPSNVDGNEFLQAPPKHQVQPLKLLATAVLKNNQISELKSNSKDALGGLRHARNKLKLDLPPSPSAFTSTKAFTIEPPEEPVTKREVPTFTTFGKSRFLVQHVDTPTCDEEKNVSFEALPYKPAQLKKDKAKIEVVRGEASLLDSADEDSGIESSTLERKKITNVAD